VSDIKSFLEGFQRFHTRYIQGESSLYSRLRQGQNPSTLVIACCDSRVDPAILTGADPGELFVVRNVANLVPPYRNGAEMPGIRADIEFAVKGLNVERIILLGHRSCGGIRALMDGEGVTKREFEFIGSWVSIASPARDRVLRELPGADPEVQARACEQYAIELSLENLVTFPWIRDRVEAGTLTLHGWYFDFESGELLGFSPELPGFRLLTGSTLSEG
jgi:carbonic anhydrase